MFLGVFRARTANESDWSEHTALSTGQFTRRQEVVMNWARWRATEIVTGSFLRDTWSTWRTCRSQVNSTWKTEKEMKQKRIAELKSLKKLNYQNVHVLSMSAWVPSPYSGFFRSRMNLASHLMGWDRLQHSYDSNEDKWLRWRMDGLCWSWLLVQRDQAWNNKCQI